jgi:hypothetical protein
MRREADGVSTRISRGAQRSRSFSISVFKALNAAVGLAPKAQYELLAAKMRQAKGKVIVSLNDHPDVRRCFGDFQVETLQIDYTVGGGAKRAPRGELIIYSWDREAEPAGLF